MLVDLASGEGGDAICVHRVDEDASRSYCGDVARARSLMGNIAIFGTPPQVEVLYHVFHERFRLRRR